MATTPPLRHTLYTPSTPLHGARYDTYHNLRKSTRKTSVRAQRAVETPPPKSYDHLQNPHLLDSKKLSSLNSAVHTFSPPSSTDTSPRKKVFKGKALNKDTSVVTNTESSSRAMSVDPNHNLAKNPSLEQPTLRPPTTMLPTPVKTPRKKPVQPAAVNAAARVLFPVRPDTIEDAMPTPRKRKSRRHVGFSLYSSMEDDGDGSSEGNIQIYTDSKDKVPELDRSEENPFIDQPTRPESDLTRKRSSKKRKTDHQVESSKEIEEAFNHEEGMVYVFRGKKIYCKFPKDDEDEEIGDSETETAPHRPLTRSSIKPRLLFPTSQQQKDSIAANIEDEEAPTDIEEHHDLDTMEEKTLKTPTKATTFTPTTPPTTGHATRSFTKKVLLDSSPSEIHKLDEPVHRAKKVGPFDSWDRRKPGTVGADKGKKREAEALERNGGSGSKKMRGNVTD